MVETERSATMTTWTQEDLDEFEDLYGAEVAELAVEQELDDNAFNMPAARIGRTRVEKITEDLDLAGPDNTQSMFDEEVDGTEKDLGWMTEAVEQLSPALREAYDLIYVQRLSLRDGAARVGISHVALLYRVQELQKQIKAAAPEGLFDADD